MEYTIKVTNYKGETFPLWFDKADFRSWSKANTPTILNKDEMWLAVRQLVSDYIHKEIMVYLGEELYIKITK